MKQSVCTVARVLALSGIAAIAGGGCARDAATTLDRDAFYRPPPGTDERRHVLKDEPGQLMYNQVRMDLTDARPPRIGEDDRPPAQERVTSISPTVRETVKFPVSSGEGAVPRVTVGGDAAPSTAPSSAPAQVRPGASSGVAMTIGTVVCEVNGEPIYADKVLASLSKVLATEAKQRDAQGFRTFARQAIGEQVRVFISSELAFAAAKRNLDAGEQELARNLAMQWRQQQITQAGGSLERARAKAAAEGYDFDERVEEEFRKLMVQIYYQKRLLPRAQVRADDMRAYYNENRSRQFTERGQAHFRLIKIDARSTGGLEPARGKISNLREKAARGEDFAELAKGANDDPMLMRNAGDVGPIDRGAFALEAVEEAVWQLQPGQVTDVIQIGDAFYIARLESKKEGRVRPFEEDAVQKEIAEALRRQQLDQLKRKHEDALMQDAIVHPFPPNIDPVVEMAVQRYPDWAAAG